MANCAAKAAFFLKWQVIFIGVCVCFSAALQASTLIQQYSLSEIAEKASDEGVALTPSLLDGRELALSLADIRVMFLALPSVDERLSSYELDLALSEALAQTNEIFLNSRVAAKVSLAYVGDWTAGGDEWLQSATAEQIFNFMRPLVNEHYWGEGRLAELYQADVIFLVDYRDPSDAYCGWAAIGSEAEIERRDATSSYGVIRLGPGCGASAYIVAHELGHLLGAAHGPDEALSATSPFGYGADCGGLYTVMHQNFPKTPYYSSSELQLSGESCGNYELQDNARLFASRSELLAGKNVDLQSGAYLVDRFRQVVDAESNSVRVSLFRGGDLSARSHLRWDYAYLYDSQESSLRGGEVVFAEGQSRAEIEVDMTWGIINNNEDFEIYFKNPANLELKTSSLPLNVTTVMDSMPIANFSVQADGLAVRFFDLSDSEANITALSWTLGDGASVLNKGQFDHQFHEDGEYFVTLDITDEFGGQDSVAMIVDVAASLAKSNVEGVAQDEAIANEAESVAGSSGGGTLTFYFLLLLLLGLRIKYL